MAFAFAFFCIPETKGMSIEEYVYPTDSSWIIANKSGSMRFISLDTPLGNPTASETIKRSKLLNLTRSTMLVRHIERVITRCPKIVSQQLLPTVPGSARKFELDTVSLE